MVCGTVFTGGNDPPLHTEGVSHLRSNRIRVRMLCLLLCLAVLLPCVSALGETTKVAAYLLRLRATPSSTGKVLDAYPRGTVVTILKKGDNWTKVRVHGKEGYMQTNLLSYARYKSSDSGNNTGNNGNTGNTGNTNTSPASGSTAYVMKGYRVNLREQPESGSAILACIRGGTRVTVLKKGKFWSHVQVKGYDGYMWSEYLTTEKE